LPWTGARRRGRENALRRAQGPHECEHAPHRARTARNGGCSAAPHPPRPPGDGRDHNSTCLQNAQALHLQNLQWPDALSDLQKGAHSSKFVSPNCLDEHLGAGPGGGGGGEAAEVGFFLPFFGATPVVAGAGTGAGVGAGAAVITGTFFFLGACVRAAPAAAAAAVTGLGKRGSAGGVCVPPQYWHVLHLQYEQILLAFSGLQNAPHIVKAVSPGICELQAWLPGGIAYTTPTQHSKLTSAALIMRQVVRMVAQRVLRRR